MTDIVTISRPVNVIQTFSGPAGPAGPTGPAGSGLQLNGYVATIEDLPTNAPAGETYVVEADGLARVSDGAGGWSVGFEIVGPPGTDGVPGPNNISTLTSVTGLTGVLKVSSGHVAGSATYSDVGAAAASHAHAASEVTSGLLGTARLGTGTADSSTYLRGDQTWAAVAGGLELGETSATAYRGDHGKTAYDHSQSAHAPANATAAGATGDAFATSHLSAFDHSKIGTALQPTSLAGGSITPAPGALDLRYLPSAPLGSAAYSSTAAFDPAGAAAAITLSSLGAGTAATHAATDFASTTDSRFRNPILSTDLAAGALAGTLVAGARYDVTDSAHRGATALSGSSYAFDLRPSDIAGGTITPATGALDLTTVPTALQPGGAAGTPSSITLTHGTGLPLSTGVTGNLSLSNFAQASGAGVLGASGAGNYSLLTLATGLSIVGGALTPAVASLTFTAADKFRYGGTAGAATEGTITAAARTVLDDTTVAAMVDTLGGASSTGTGGLVRATSPTLVTPTLGTPASGDLANCTFPLRNTLTTANIIGLGFSCSSTVITVESGQCVTESGSVIAYSGGTLTPGTLTASTFYHLYLYLSGGTAALELVTTAPATPYLGTARSKTGATGYRYLGSVLTDSGGALYPQVFVAQTCEVRYLVLQSTFPALSGGTQNSTFATISLTSFIPTTATFVYARLNRASGTGNVNFSNPSSGVTLEVLSGSAPEKSAWLPCDSSQNISYYCGSSTSATVYVYGYRSPR